MPVVINAQCGAEGRDVSARQMAARRRYEHNRSMEKVYARDVLRWPAADEWSPLHRVSLTPESSFEAEAESLADHALAGYGPALSSGPLRRTARVGGSGDLSSAPASVDRVLAGGGASLATDVRGDMERRFGHDFSRVRVHSGAAAHRSALEMRADAYTVGDDIVFARGRYAPSSAEGNRLLAHELAHVIQGGSGVVRPYRNPKSFNFGVADDAALKEDSFQVKRDKKRDDKETKPWINKVAVKFATKTTDADGSRYWKGTANASYHSNPVKEADFTFPIAGGSRDLGLTDKGDGFTVHRIEGLGYNSGTFSGTSGVDFDPAEREGPGKRYTKKDATGDRPANMSFAVFYHKGEALHAGPIDFSSHGCVHVDWTSMDTAKRLNYHSVIGLTKVSVSYP